jgi:hypothetical protein
MWESGCCGIPVRDRDRLRGQVRADDLARTAHQFSCVQCDRARAAADIEHAHARAKAGVLEIFARHLADQTFLAR